MNKRQRKKHADKVWVTVKVPRSHGKGTMKAKFSPVAGWLYSGCGYSVLIDFQYYQPNRRL
jgi:roadblock/LC7 domain-containing protein